MEYFREEDFEGLEPFWIMSKEDIRNERYNLVLDMHPTLPENPTYEDLERVESGSRKLFNVLWIMQKLHNVIEYSGNSEGDLPNTQEEADRKSEGVVRGYQAGLFCVRWGYL